MFVIDPLREAVNEASFASVIKMVSIPNTASVTIFCAMGCAIIGRSRLRVLSVLTETLCWVKASVVGYSPAIAAGVSGLSCDIRGKREITDGNACLQVNICHKLREGLVDEGWKIEPTSTKELSNNDQRPFGKQRT